MLRLVPRRFKISGPVGRLSGSRWSRARHNASSSAGTPSTHSAGGTGSCDVFIESTSTRRSDERRPSDERLVEDDADAVPVRGRSSAPRPSPAREPCSGPYPRPRPARRGSRRPSGRGRSRPRSRGSPRDRPLRDEHVRRLDVAVQLARACSACTPSTSCRSARRSRSKSAGDVLGAPGGALTASPTLVRDGRSDRFQAACARRSRCARQVALRGACRASEHKSGSRCRSRAPS